MTRLLLRLFPASWRARYGQELRDLMAETGLTPRIAADVARAGLAEQIRTLRDTFAGGTSMVVGPAWRHPTAWAVVGLIALAPTLLVIGMSIATPYQLARVGLLELVDSLQLMLNTNRAADLLVVLLPALAALTAAVPLIRLGYTRVDGVAQASLSVRLRALNIVIVVAALAIGCLLVGHILFESVMQVGA